MQTFKERWKPIKNYEGYYEISSFGRIKSLDRWVTARWGKRLVKSRILKPNNSTKGYLGVFLSKEGSSKRFLIHRLVALHFIERKELSKDQVNHKDGNKENNTIENLEWMNVKQNMRHARALGLYDNVVGKISKSVNQYTLKGTFIKRHESIIRASKDTGVSDSNIGSVCKGKRNQAGGFIWKYAT